MSRSELHNWECAIERLCGDKTMMKYKMLAIAQDIYNTAYVHGKNYMSLVEMPKARNNVLDKIKAEVKALSNANPSYTHTCDVVDREDVLEIIDKYKTESEDE